MSSSRHIFVAAALSVLITGCATNASTHSATAIDQAAADIGLLSEAGRQVGEITTPLGYQQGDDLITYEGPGWESDKVAFRLYLDGRNALDVFGKKQPDLILSGTGRGDDYHQMADWGMDILKVGASLGAGGVGVFENGKVRQIGEAERYKAEIREDTDMSATVRVSQFKSESCKADTIVDYTIAKGRRVTDVAVLSGCALPWAAGLVIHPGTEHLDSSGTGGDWQYIARYGKQSLVPDGLGLAIFYRASDIAETGQDEDDDYIVFKSGIMPTYKTAAAWAQEPGGLSDGASFKDWLDETQTALNQDTN